MSDTKHRIPLALADELAAGVVEYLESACLRIEIAGSIRRRRQDVGDIEIVCWPRPAQAGRDLFGEAVPSDPLDHALNGHIDRLREAKVLSLRPDPNGRTANGSRHKRLLFHSRSHQQPFALDLFCVLVPAQFGVIYTIRTGSAEFSHKLVTPRLLGGWLPTGYRVHDGAIWQGETMVPTPEESDVFALLGAPRLAPERRTATVQLISGYRGEKRWRDTGLPA